MSAAGGVEVSPAFSAPTCVGSPPRRPTTYHAPNPMAASSTAAPPIAAGDRPFFAPAVVAVAVAVFAVTVAVAGDDIGTAVVPGDGDDGAGAGAVDVAAVCAGGGGGGIGVEYPVDMPVGVRIVPVGIARDGVISSSVGADEL